jgi:hypothetical protein
LTKRVIALAWAVDPLAFSVFFPPQVTFPDDAPEVALAPLDPLEVFFSLPHPDNTSAAPARTVSAAPNLLSFNSVPHSKDIAAARGRGPPISRFLAAMKLTATRLTFGEFCAAVVLGKAGTQSRPFRALHRPARMTN